MRTFAYKIKSSKTCTIEERVNPDLFVKAGDFLFSRANTVELDGEPSVERADALIGDPGKRFDYVLANPPFGKKSSMTITYEEGEEDKDALTYERRIFGKPHPISSLTFCSTSSPS
jgi:hypothetical protein